MTILSSDCDTAQYPNPHQGSKKLKVVRKVCSAPPPKHFRIPLVLVEYSQKPISTGASTSTRPPLLHTHVTYISCSLHDSPTQIYNSVLFCFLFCFYWQAVPSLDSPPCCANSRLPKNHLSKTEMKGQVTDEFGWVHKERWFSREIGSDSRWFPRWWVCTKKAGNLL